MDKQYTNIPSNIGQYKSAVYELYFNSVLKKKWVNGSRTQDEMVKEILRTEQIPTTISKANIIMTKDGDKTVVWEYIKQSKPIYDNLTGETYPNFYLANLQTGVLRQTIINQCNKPFCVNKRFKYL